MVDRLSEIAGKGNSNKASRQLLVANVSVDGEAV